MIRFIKYILFCFVVFLSSCSSYQSFSIDVLVPAEYSVPPIVKSVVLVDNSIPYRDTTLNVIRVDNKELSIDSIWLDDFAAITLKSLKEELESRGFYDTVYYHSVALKSDLNNSYRALNWLQADSLCKMYNAEAVIAFEANYYKTAVNADVQYDGGYFAYMDVNGGILWRGYNNLSRTELFKEVQVDTISWQSSGGSLQGAVSQFPDLKVAFSNLAEYLGYEAANHTTPTWRQEERGIYDSGNYQFLEAADYVRSKDYGEAVKLWKYAFDHSKLKHKARAAYNLAVIAEILGDFDSAKYWLMEASSIYSSHQKASFANDKARATAYWIILNKRAMTINKLKEQVGGGF